MFTVLSLFREWLVSLEYIACKYPQAQWDHFCRERQGNLEVLAALAVRQLRFCFLLVVFWKVRWERLNVYSFRRRCYCRQSLLVPRLNRSQTSFAQRSVRFGPRSW